MRIIAGKAKNRKLKAPKGQDTRPITDMIKEALFNVLGDRTENALVLDLFAGSGSVGLEALSRGAKLVIFIDKSNHAIKTIKDNLQHCNFTEGFEVYKNDVFKATDILTKRDLSFDIIYIDPPFTEPELFEQVIVDLNEKIKLLAKDGVIIIRSSGQHNLLEEYKNLVRNRINKYGESILHYYFLKP